VKKLAEGAQTVFTESTWQQHHLNGSPEMEGKSKEKEKR